MNRVISKNNLNPSKFRNLNIGEITNQTIKGKSEQTVVFGVWVPAQIDAAAAPAEGKSSIGQTQRGGLCLLQVRASSK